eukprot:scaffold31776_cov13-Tisochrysis_lutea.AAC.1
MSRLRQAGQTNRASEQRQANANKQKSEVCGMSSRRVGVGQSALAESATKEAVLTHFQRSQQCSLS